jgi:hypothetical protein
MNRNSDFAKGEFMSFLGTSTSMPYTDYFYSNYYYQPRGYSLTIEESLIRLKIDFSIYQLSETIVFERTGTHTLWDGDEISLTLASDNFTPTLPARNASCPNNGIYGCEKDITQIGTVTIRLDAEEVGSAGASCSCSCLPSSYGSLPYTTPDTYTLQFQNLNISPNGPRSYRYDAQNAWVTRLTSNDALWNDVLTAPHPQDQRWSAFVPSGPVMRERYANNYYPSADPPNYRLIATGCNGSLARLANPIILRKPSQGAQNPLAASNADYIWISDPILLEPGLFVRYAFTRCLLYEGSSTTLPTLYQFFTQGSRRWGQGQATGDSSYRNYTQTDIATWGCAWDRKTYQETPQAYADYIKQLVFKFGENDDPFATVTAGGTYSPESYVQCANGYSSSAAGCNGYACPPTSATVTLQSTSDFPYGGSYNVPINGFGNYTFTGSDGWQVAISVFITGNEGEAVKCGCDSPYNVVVQIGSRSGQSYYGLFKSAKWISAACVGSCLSGQFTCSNNGKGSYQDINFYQNYYAAIDVASSVSVTF